MPVRRWPRCSPANALLRDYVPPKQAAVYVAGGRMPTEAVHRHPAQIAPCGPTAAVTPAPHRRWNRPCTLQGSSAHDDHRTARRVRRGERPGCMPSSTRYRATGQHSERKTSGLPLIPVSSRTAVADREWLQRPNEADVARWVRCSSDACASSTTRRASPPGRVPGRTPHHARSDQSALVCTPMPRAVTHRVHARQTSVRP